MFRYDKVESICKKLNYVIELRTYNYSKQFQILTYETRCKQGKVPVGYIEFEDIVTRDGVQYVKKIHLYTELTMNVESNSIKPEDWHTTEHEFYLFLVKWRLKNFQKQINDFDAHITFLQTHEKQTKANKLEIDAQQDFK